MILIKTFCLTHFCLSLKRFKVEHIGLRSNRLVYCVISKLSMTSVDSDCESGESKSINNQEYQRYFGIADLTSQGHK